MAASEIKIHEAEHRLVEKSGTDNSPKMNGLHRELHNLHEDGKQQHVDLMDTKIEHASSEHASPERRKAAVAHLLKQESHTLGQMAELGIQKLGETVAETVADKNPKLGKVIEQITPGAAQLAGQHVERLAAKTADNMHTSPEHVHEHEHEHEHDSQAKSQYAEIGRQPMPPKTELSERNTQAQHTVHEKGADNMIKEVAGHVAGHIVGRELKKAEHFTHQVGKSLKKTGKEMEKNAEVAQKLLDVLPPSVRRELDVATEEFGSLDVDIEASKLGGKGEQWLGNSVEKGSQKIKETRHNLQKKREF